jgi:hypothetical protein
MLHPGVLSSDIACKVKFPKGTFVGAPVELTSPDRIAKFNDTEFDIEQLLPVFLIEDPFCSQEGRRRRYALRPLKTVATLYIEKKR